VLAALSLGAVALGVASGGLTASLLALVLSGGLALTGAEWGSGVGLVLGVLAGLAMAGWVAGWRAVHSPRFHGQVAGLILAFVIFVVARLGGSPAGAGTVLWLALVSVVVAGAAGWLAGRRKAAGH
jgi:hypothetical protein